ncbi:MAG: MBL fold metallo-hydrolase RNA specificity domain-containing protein [Acidobacteriota bacterium]
MAILKFLGATRTVTGSRHLIEVDGRRFLIDCGLFQGLKQLRLRNWEPFPIDPASIEAVILTHGHIDHSGYLPRLAREGFRGPVYATPATVELARILLPDSARLQEEEADYANKVGSSKHHPAMPLYRESDVHEVLHQFESVNYGRSIELTPRLSFDFIDAGHIIGSSFVRLRLVEPDGEEKIILLTGDIGRYGEPIIHDPSPVAAADYLVLESTYGDREHQQVDARARLAEIVNATVARGGHLLIPAFAVGRTQTILYYLRELEEAGLIPVVPVIVDSPMASNATRLYLRHTEGHDIEMKDLLDERRNPLATKRFNLVRTRDESKSVTNRDEPTIVISASGMCTGGRILHHLRRRLPDPRNTILFVGFQAAGTRGRRILNGEPEVRIFGQMVPVRAHVETLESLSAHADYHEILRWLDGFEKPPRRTFLVHGEPEAAESLRQKIAARAGWAVEIPDYLDEFEL